MKKTNIFGLVLILSTLLIGCAQPNMCADIPEVYTITCGENVTVNKTQAMAGEMITVTADSVANKRFSAITLDGESISTTTTATFEMPTKNVSIDAVYAQLYTISCATNNSNWGGVTCDKTSAIAGETITVTATPESGWRVFDIKVGNEHLTISDNTAEFTMPVNNVNVIVTFISNVTHIKLFREGQLLCNNLGWDYFTLDDARPLPNVSGTNVTYSGLRFYVDTNGDLSSGGTLYKPINFRLSDLILEIDLG